MVSENWPLALSRRHQGRHLYLGNWEIEKLAQVVEGLVQIRSAMPEPNELTGGLYEAWRNSCKLAMWMGGADPDAYDEDRVESTLGEGEASMKGYIEQLLEGVLEPVDSPTTVANESAGDDGVE